MQHRTLLHRSNALTWTSPFPVGDGATQRSAAALHALSTNSSNSALTPPSAAAAA